MNDGFGENMIKAFSNLLENVKEKEFICCYKVSETINEWKLYYFTKSQLLNFVENKNLDDCIIFKSEQEIKLNKKIEIEEK